MNETTSSLPRTSTKVSRGRILIPGDQSFPRQQTMAGTAGRYREIKQEVESLKLFFVCTFYSGGCFQTDLGLRRIGAPSNLGLGLVH